MSTIETSCGLTYIARAGENIVLPFSVSTVLVWPIGSLVESLPMPVTLCPCRNMYGRRVCTTSHQPPHSFLTSRSPYISKLVTRPVLTEKESMRRTDDRHSRITQLHECAVEGLSFFLSYVELLGRFAFDASTLKHGFKTFGGHLRNIRLTTGKCSKQRNHSQELTLYSVLIAPSPDGRVLPRFIRKSMGHTAGLTNRIGRKMVENHSNHGYVQSQ